jgi:RHS repeat-associated protein
MKKRYLATALLFIIFSGIATGQVATGMPNFGSFGGGPFDNVNLGNLNTHFSIPILNKAGRGTPFGYNLAYDSLIWTPATVSGSTVWQPATNWGWQGPAEVKAGYITYTTWTKPKMCYDPDTGYSPQTFWNAWTYRDTRGVFHHFFGLTSTGCPNGNGPASITVLAKDGSGYTLYATAGSAYITDASGRVINPPMNVQAGVPMLTTDRNGNQISMNANNQFFDTLSSTTPVLTVSGGGTPTSPVKYQYTAPSGGTASYVANYTQYTVKTNFGVTGIAEYGPLSNALVTSITLPDGTSYGFTYEPTPGSCAPLSGTSSCVTGRIATVTIPTGGTVSYTYGTTGGTSNTGIFSDGSLAGLTRQLNPGGEWQYIRSLVSGTPAPGSTWTTTVIDPNNNYTVINEAEDGFKTTPTYFFYETQRQVYQGSVSPSNLLRTTIECYNAVYAGCATASVTSPITQTDAYSQLPNGSTRLSETLYNGFGLVTDDKEYTYGVALGTAPSSTYLVRETAVSYATLGNGIVNKPSSVTVYDWSSGSAVTLASSSYTYDQGTPTATSGTPQHIAIGGSRGNVTTATISTSATATLSKTLTYYDTGNPSVATDVNGAQTTYVYGTGSCGNSFATTINEPLSLSRSMTWNCTGGIATQVTDENGNNVTSSYTDSNFWRPAALTDQMTNQTTINYVSKTAVEAALQNFNGGNSVSDVRSTVDGFGRPILNQRLQGPGASNYDTTETDYNNIGLAVRSTMPFSAAAGSTNSSAPGTNTTHDALGRVLTITDSNGGTVSYTYTNNDVLQKVSGGQTFQKQLEYDGLGRLTSVCEMTQETGSGICGQSNSVNGFWTKYTSDALGHLLTVTQNAQGTASAWQTRSFTYDMLGRMISENNPETGKSGVNGTITYTYDSISPCGDGTNYSYRGDLVQKKNNAGSITCYKYDALHRVLKAGNTSISGSTVRNFVYDSKSSYPTGISVLYGNTHMVEAQTTSTSGSVITDEFFSYDKRGELTDVYESTPHYNSAYYHTTASYWPTGILKSLSGIPGVPTINYGANGSGLDGEGRITQVTASSGQNPVTNVTYWTSSTTNPLGALTGVTFGSGDRDSFGFDPNTGRMTSYSFSVNGQTDSGALYWNPNGTLIKLVITDHIPGTADSQTCNYGYDDLQRLDSASCGSLWSQTFSYDAFGNITKSGSGTFAPLYTFSNGATTNQFFSLPSVSVSYDSNGNLLTDNLNSYTWDPNWGTMLTVSNGSTLVTATYDALGRMVENNAGGTWTEFLYGPTGKLAKMNGSTLVRAFIALPGGAKAIYNSTGLAYYRHSDWLGSSRLTSTAAPPTSMYSSSAYAPFGEQYATAGSADASFTGQDQDTTSTLYDFPARRESPSQGRWISPDPSGRAAVKLANPQSWNRYAYVNNNPLRLIDPLGLHARRHRHYIAADEGSGDDDDDDGGGGDDDDSGGGDNSGDDDCPVDACVTATDPGQDPCIFVIGGVTDNMGDLSAINTMGGEASAPLDQSVVGGNSTDANAVAGIFSVGSQGFWGTNDSSNQLTFDLGGVLSNNSNVIVVAFSGGAQTFATALQNFGGFPSGITGVAWVEAGIPGGFPEIPSGVPQMVFSGGGVTNGALGLMNSIGGFLFGGQPGPTNGVPGCDEHDFDCAVTGPNGVLNGVQSNCNGEGGNDAVVDPNVGELANPDQERWKNAPLLKTVPQMSIIETADSKEPRRREPTRRGSGS